jgi:hypothetical protein
MSDTGATREASLRAFAALAILKVNWDDRRDYIANFVPLIAHCLTEADSPAVSVPDVQARIEDTFGLRIPQGAMKTILGRAARDGLVTRRQNIYEPNAEALDGMNLGPARATVLRQHAHLVERLREFAAGLGRSWSAEQAERALLAFVETLAEPILEASVDGSPLVELPHTGGDGSTVVSQFVLELCRHEPKAFDYLETIVKGSMLANVLYFPEAFSGGRAQLGEIDIYLDTPIVLRVAGYAEGHYRAPASEMVELLRGQGASLKIFEHTLHEVEGVLSSAARSYRVGRPGEVAGDVVDFFASENLSDSDVQALLATLDDRLAAHGIQVVDSPKQTEQLAVDEDALERGLNQTVGYRRREALLRDLDSLTAIHRIREGQIRRRIEHSDAIFVTSNLPLVWASKDFFAPLHGGGGVPLCILDTRLAALAWLMNPVQAADLPRKQIIATSFAALNPSENVWRKYLSEIRRLADKGELSEDQVALLVFSPEARLELMNATDGDADAFTEGTVAQVLEHARASAQAEVLAELAVERRRREEAEEAMAKEKALASEALSEAKTVAGAHAGQLSAVARRVSRFIGWGFFLLGLAVVVVGTGFATSSLFPERWSRAVPFAASFLIVVAVLFGVASIAWGFSLKTIIARTERLLHRPIESILQRLFTPPDTHGDRS